MNTNITIRRFLALFLSLSLMLSGTALAGGGKGKKNFSEGRKYENAQQWDLAAQAYALAVSAEPDNPEYRLHYLRALSQASLMYVKRGDVLAEQNDFAGAYTAYRTSYQYDPGNEIARIKMQGMIEQQKAIANGLEPVSYTNSGNVKPTSDVQISQKPRNRDLLQNVAFKDASFKSVVNTLGKQLGLNVLFDDAVKDEKVTVDMNDVTLAKALDNIMFMKKYTFEQMDRRTIIVYQDNATNKPRFEKLMVKAFYLGNINAGTAQRVVTLALGNQRQVQPLDGGGGAGPGGGGSANSNILLVKATPQELQVAQQVLEMVDKNKNEVVLDVEIYEVSHDSLIQIGNQVATSSQQIDQVEYIDKTTGKPFYRQTPTASLANLGGLGAANALGSTVNLLGGAGSFLGMGALIGLPPTTISFLQTKGNSKLLNRTQIHVLDGQANTTKVGRSVPVRLGTQYGYSGFGNSTGLVNGQQAASGLGGLGGLGGFGGLGAGIDSIQYRDVGLVIEATPTITNEGYVEVKMKFETSDVASSGSSANLTPEFTQRSLQTVARIKDGVTSVVAGVNQESKGESRASIPVLGMLPILGRFFTTPNQNQRQSDIVITVTPHIVRSAGITQKDYLAIYAGGAGTQGSGLPPSVEDVVYRAQQEEEQERRLIALNSPGPATQNVPITADSNPASNNLANNNLANNNRANNNLGNGGLGNAEGPVVTPRNNPSAIQQVGNANNGAPARRQVGNDLLVPVANTTSSPTTLVIQEPVQQVELTSASDATNGEANPGKSGKEGKEGELAEGQVIQPENPVPIATVVSGMDNPERAEKLKKMRAMWEEEQKKQAEEAKAKKSKKSEPAPAQLTPEVSGPKTKVSQALPTMMSTPRSNVSFSLSPTPIRQQKGKTFSVTVEAAGQGQMMGATLSIKFDDSKLQIKSVRGGELFGQQPELSSKIDKGSLNVSIKNAQKTAVGANGRMLVIEFEAIAEGSTEIAFNKTETKVNLSNTMSALASGAAAQVVISRDAVTSATNER